MLLSHFSLKIVSATSQNIVFYNHFAPNIYYFIEYFIGPHNKAIFLQIVQFPELLSPDARWRQW